VSRPCVALCLLCVRPVRPPLCLFAVQHTRIVSRCRRFRTAASFAFGLSVLGRSVSGLLSLASFRLSVSASVAPLSRSPVPAFAFLGPSRLRASVPSCLRAFAPLRLRAFVPLCLRPSAPSRLRAFVPLRLRAFAPPCLFASGPVSGVLFRCSGSVCASPCLLSLVGAPLLFVSLRLRFPLRPGIGNLGIWELVFSDWFLGLAFWIGFLGFFFVFYFVYITSFFLSRGSEDLAS
jgi:hypothetical protein